MSEEKAPEVPKRKPWSAGDRRLLVITIAGAAAGGLAANLGTVLILGLGLAYLHQRHSAGVSAPILVAATGGLAAFCVALLVPVIVWSRSKNAKKHSWIRWTAWSLAAVLASSVLLFLVVLAGVAAGVK